MEQNDVKSRPKVTFWSLVFISLLASFTSGIVLSWTAPVFIKLNSTNPDVNPLGKPINAQEQSWIASTFGIGCIFGPLTAAFTVSKFGRKFTLLFNVGIIYLVSLTILAFSKLTMLYYIARFFNGFAHGNVCVVVPMYLGEISETYNRGNILGLINFMLCLGELYDFSLGPYLSIMSFTCICAAIPGLLLITFVFYPESPYYLVFTNRTEKAEKALMILRSRTRQEVQEELKLIEKTVEVDKSKKVSCHDILKYKELRKALEICFVLVAVGELSGMTPIEFYMTNIFEATGSSLNSDVCSIVAAVVQVISGLIGLLLSDRYGRRILLLISALGMCISNSIMGLYFVIKKYEMDTRSIYWFPITSLMMYMMMYNVGFGAVTETVLGEIFPSTYKAIASMSVAIFDWILGSIVSHMYPIVSEHMGEGINFSFYSLCCLLGFLYLSCCMIETKEKTFLEIQQMLAQ